MSLYCATGSIEADLFPQLKDLLSESWRSSGNRTACSQCRLTKAACIPARRADALCVGILRRSDAGGSAGTTIRGNSATASTTLQGKMCSLLQIQG